MAWFKIYAGLGGGFGGAEYIGTFEFENQDEALEYAYQAAIECYESYEGEHGLLDWNECREELKNSGYDYDDGEVDEYYGDEIESWVDYYVDPATGPDDGED